DLIAVSGRALETSDNSLRYVTVRTNESKTKLIYGIDKLKSSERILLVEGPLDSLFLNNCLASGDANLLSAAKEVHGDVTLVFDNEPRNKEICKMIERAIHFNQPVVIWPDTIKGKDQTKSILVNPASSKNANSNTFPIDADFTKITLICSLQPGQSRRDLQIKEISQHDLNAINHKQWSGHRWQITGSALVDGTALTYQLYKDGNSNLNA
ncbi:hypothetical protein EBR77_01775, partial [bacterium]|nr:hypothetical protein [bacterium]